MGSCDLTSFSHERSNLKFVKTCPVSGSLQVHRPHMLNNHLARASLIGPNLRTFLQGYITCDLDDLQSGLAMPMAITEIKGRVVANGWVLEEGEHLVLLVHASTIEIVQQHLLPYMRFARCELSVESDPFHITQSPDTESPRFNLNDSEFGFTDKKDQACHLGEFQLRTGYALVTSATSGKFLPQMLNLTDFDTVSFSKGCYLGQEVVARAQHRGQVKRRLLLVSDDTSDLAIGDQVQTQSGNKAVIVAQSADATLVIVSTAADGNDLKLVTEQVT